MRRHASTRTWLIGAAWAVLAAVPGPSRADDPPPLESPSGSPPLEAPAIDPPTPIPSPASAVPAPATDRLPTARASRPVLALPGVTMPTARPVPMPSPSPLPPSLAPTSDGGLPPLDVPSPGIDPPRGPATTLPALPSSRFRGRVIESVPADGDLPPIAAPPLNATTGPASGALAPRRAGGLLRLEEVDERDLRALDRLKGADEEPEDETPRDLPARRPGLFGGWAGNPFGPRRGAGSPASAIRAEPRSDPAADAALKRRVERQAREAVGDRARSVDVRVVGRSIAIQARGVRFFQRRAVRRGLETLPSIAGYQSTIDLLD